MQWVKLGKKGRIDAFFGGEEALKKMATDWADFKVLAKGQTEEGPVDYQDLKDESKADRYKLNHGYDESKDDSQLDLEDLKAAAEFRGGEVLSQKMEKGDLYTKIQWKCHNGHVFESTPYTILKAGFWCPECCEALPWAYNKVAKSIPFYAQIWYDTQSKDEEDRVYPYSQDNDDDMLKPVEKL